MRSGTIRERIIEVVDFALANQETFQLAAVNEQVDNLVAQLVKDQKSKGDEPMVEVVIDHVDTKNMIVAALVRTPRNPKNKRHRIGHLRGEGWFCNECRNARCAQIKRVQALVPEMKK